ncbi:MAG: hypothetical protein WDN04_25120 [Rhodospirillales bacterium]
MSATVELRGLAARIVADLMPIALAVSGVGEAAFAAALAEAGATPEIFVAGEAVAYDLAILLAPPDAARDLVEAARIQSLATATDRLLLIPVPLGAAGPLDLDAWFEIFAEHGFQPVVEYDTAFLGQGAFLVDRNATAAESELSAFAERLALGGALASTSQRVAVLEAELAEGGDRDHLKKALDARQAEIAALVAREAALRNRTDQAEAAAASLRTQLIAWQRLGTWIGVVIQSRDRNTIAALHEARGSVPKPRGFWGRLRRRRESPSADDAQLLADAALLRACPLFDPAWYLAQRPQLAASGADPVWDFLLHGAAEGIAPGPWFDSAAYVARFPESQSNPLLHAIKSGEADEILGRVQSDALPKTERQ